jgi:RHS repeat-associated protein
VVTSAGTTTIAYDYRGRATSIVGPGVAQTNVFNGLDTRVGSVTNGVARTFLRDGAYVTDPVLTDGAAFYTPGVSERRGSVTTFLHSGIKNAEAQSSASGLSASREYDAFGNVISGSGAWQGPFGYGGGFGYQEDATGLKLLGHRLYDPSTGRFLTRDPIKDGRNWYVYCANDPVNQADPDGLTPKLLVVIPVALAIWDIYDAIQNPSPENIIGIVPGPFKLPKWFARARKIVDDIGDRIRPVPNPGGRLGGPDHRRVVAEVGAAYGDDLRHGGGVHPEKKFGGRFPDAVAETKGKWVCTQVGRGLKDGSPPEAELKAIDDILADGKIEAVDWVPYR